ncbi:MAG: DUF2029 domain-containing protein [Deltaproteobacteria bacterium]|nr:DUF2029 domain-containing protein [Deltaproteobacteria bacterium]
MEFRIGKTWWWAIALTIFMGWMVYYLQNRTVDVGCDLQAYLDGARAVEEGKSPYGPAGQSDYLYHPALALFLDSVGATRNDPSKWWFAWLAASAFVLLAGAAALAGGVGSPWGLALFLLLFTDMVNVGIDYGNIAIGVAAIVVLALLVLKRAPVAAGVLFALAVILKTVPVVFLVYMAGRWMAGRSRRQDRICLVTAFALLVASLLLPWMTDYVTQAGALVEDKLGFGSNYSWAAWAYRMSGGRQILPFGLTLAAAILGAFGLGRFRRGGDKTHWAILFILAWFASPIIWNYSNTLCFVPFAVWMDRAFDGTRSPPRPRAARLLDILFLAIFVLSMLQMDFFWDSSLWIGRNIFPLIPMTIPLIAGCMLLLDRRVRPVDSAC